MAGARAFEQVGLRCGRAGLASARHRFARVDVIAARDEWVVLGFLWEVRGAGSGAPIASRILAAYRVVDGTIREGHFRWSAAEALAAAGLDPA